MSNSLTISKEQFRDLYENKKLTTSQIAEKFNCCQTTIWKKFKEFNIKPRFPGSERIKISKEKLKELYINKKLSTWQMEKILNIPRSTIYRKIKENGLLIRDRSDSHLIYEKKDFSGNLLEKAYLIGFRIGDLGVRKQYPQSKTICIASGSTIQEQINLIENMFKNYGKVWMKKTGDKINVQIILNSSFGFLISKEFPKWINKKKEIFFSFLAGFTDAEGTISQSRKIDYYSLGNYDSKLLFIIYKSLNKFGIKCLSPKKDNRKGKKNSQGYRYSANYWSIRIYDKENVLKLLLKLKPYIKHGNKIKALNNAIENINNRNRRNNHE